MKDKQDTQADELNVLSLYDVIDGWYHEHTRHHLADVDADVAVNMFDPLMKLADAHTAKAVLRCTDRRAAKSHNPRPGDALEFREPSYVLNLKARGGISERIAALQSQRQSLEDKAA